MNVVAVHLAILLLLTAAASSTWGASDWVEVNIYTDMPGCTLGSGGPLGGTVFVTNNIAGVELQVSVTVSFPNQPSGPSSCCSQACSCTVSGQLVTLGSGQTLSVECNLPECDGCGGTCANDLEDCPHHGFCTVASNVSASIVKYRCTGVAEWTTIDPVSLPYTVYSPCGGTSSVGSDAELNEAAISCMSYCDAIGSPANLAKFVQEMEVTAYPGVPGCTYEDGLLDISDPTGLEFRFNLATGFRNTTLGDDCEAEYVTEGALLPEGSMNVSPFVEDAGRTCDNAFCDGGSNDGDHCIDLSGDSDCPDSDCASPSHCPTCGYHCSEFAPGRCVTGSNKGNKCDNDSHCAGGTCKPLLFEITGFRCSLHGGGHLVTGYCETGTYKDRGCTGSGDCAGATCKPISVLWDGVVSEEVVTYSLPTWLCSPNGPVCP